MKISRRFDWRREIVIKELAKRIPSSVNELSFSISLENEMFLTVIHNGVRIEFLVDRENYIEVAERVGDRIYEIDQLFLEVDKIANGRIERLIFRANKFYKNEVISFLDVINFASQNEMLTMIRTNKKISAIKEIRKEFNISLIAAKAAVDEVCESY